MALKANCLDCNKQLSTSYSKRCRPCAGKLRLMENNPHWKGGFHYKKCGYKMIYMPNHPFSNQYGYIREHRLVMEKHLGRHLHISEVVHHINGIKSDNRIENLELMNNQSIHARNHGLSESGIKTRFKKGQIPWNKKENKHGIKS
jgi:hypothetical protein